jgi:hypothetical protein
VGPWLAVLNWSVIDGRHECVALHVQQAGVAAILTASLLRKLPVADWIAQDRAGMTPRQTTTGMRTSTLNRLKEAAEVYREALRYREPPTKAVAEHFDISHGGASNLVSRARAAGLLPPTSPGVAVGDDDEAILLKMRPGPEREAALADLARQQRITRGEPEKID